MNRNRSSGLPEDVVDLLQHDAELLAVADAVQATYQPTRPRWREPRMLMAVAAAGVAVALAAFLAAGPAGRSFVASANAALGDGAVVHVVLTRDDPQTEVVTATGASSPILVRDEFWYDRESGQLRTRSSRNGQVVVDTVSSAANPADVPDAALSTFPAGYEAALKAGTMQEAGSGSFAGQNITWLQLAPGERVGISDDTHLPVVVRRLSADKIEDWTVTAIDSESRQPGLFAEPAQPQGFVSGDVESTTVLSPTNLSRLPFTPLQPRASVRGWRLVRISREQLVNRTADGTSSEAIGVRFTYASADGSKLEVMEAAVPPAAYGFINGLTFNFVPVPSDGSFVIYDARGTAVAQLARRDLFISVRAPAAPTAAAVASELAAMP